MNITISHTRPTTKPVCEYETRFLYIGFRYRYDIQKKTISSIEKKTDGTIVYSEQACDIPVFSQGHHTENVRVIVYSESPRVWCEEISPTDSFVFSEFVA